VGTPETQTIERLFQARASLAVVEQVVASLDEAGRQDPRFARETWQAASLAAITTWQSGGDSTLARPLRCLRRSLELWQPDSLDVPEVNVAYTRLEPNLRGDPIPFGPLQFDFKLRCMFDSFGSDWVMRHFQIPAPLLAWLNLAQGRTWYSREDAYALKLYGHERIFNCTEHNCETFRWDRVCAAEETPPKRPESEFDAIFDGLSELTPRAGTANGTGAWLSIGDWSDKHSIELCCHGEGQLSAVRDFHDGHPWLNGGGFGSRKAEAVLDYLTELASPDKC